jgi:hypothetical protein
MNTATRGSRGGGRGRVGYQDRYCDHRAKYDQHVGYERGGYEHGYDQCNNNRGGYGGG